MMGPVNDAVRCEGGGEETVAADAPASEKQRKKEERKSRKEKRQASADAENAAPNQTGGRDHPVISLRKADEAGVVEGGAEGVASHVVPSSIRAQEMAEARVGHLNDEMDKLKDELKGMQQRAIEAEKIVEQQKQTMHQLNERNTTANTFQEQIMTMVNYAVGPMQAELEVKKAENAKLMSTLGMQNAQVAKIESEAKSKAEVRATQPPHCPLHSFPPLVS